MRMQLGRIVGMGALAALLSTVAAAQSARTLSTFAGGTEGWFQNFGTISSIAASGGNLTWDSPAGSTGAISDPFNNDPGATYAPGSGGIDLTGMSSLEFDLGYVGIDPSINVQFFVQTGTASTYTALGPDQTITAGAGTTTYVAPLQGVGIPADDFVAIRTIGINIRTHTDTAIFTLAEVRSVGTPLTSRTLASFAAGSPDSGYNSAIVNFEGTGVQGNTAQDTSGLTVNLGAGVDGALEWTDVGGGPGGAITIFGGLTSQFFGFVNRTVDLSNYDLVRWTIIATGADSTINAQPFAQNGGFATYSSEEVVLTVDGQPHDYDLSVAAIAAEDNIQTLGINLHSHASDALIQIDSIQAVTLLPTPTPNPASVENWNLY